MDKVFRSKIIALAKGKAMKVIEDVLDGKEVSKERQKEASKSMDWAVTVDRLNQLSVKNDRSFGLQLVHMLPKVEQKAFWDRYIKITKPEIRGLLLSRPATK